ncbi:MAG: hypothetical protein OXG04_05485 [Acidobacteria bacterium]|nr:hypothetical protein [Acidobacteriota bacterium]
MTGEITLSGQVLPVGGIKEKVLAAHRCRMAGVILPWENRKEVDEDLGDDLRETVEIHYVTRGSRSCWSWRCGLRRRRTRRRRSCRPGGCPEHRWTGRRQRCPGAYAGSRVFAEHGTRRVARRTPVARGAARTRAAAYRHPALPRTVHRPMGHGGDRGRTSAAPDT